MPDTMLEVHLTALRGIDEELCLRSEFGSASPVLDLLRRTESLDLLNKRAALVATINATWPKDYLKSLGIDVDITFKKFDTARITNKVHKDMFSLRYHLDAMVKTHIQASNLAKDKAELSRRTFLKKQPIWAQVLTAILFP